ncbi:uncharacterized protein LOC142238318 [Haematobia irritans]|uniref:uncharacterized protein LOC142238318 n=1 Tax=Haematobia irritans TaxID=7368 RepID=UPI003F508AD7
MYIPPVCSCAPGYSPNIEWLLCGHNRLVLGDFNAYHELWHSPLGNDQRGIALAEQIDDSIFCTANEEAPTRIMGDCSSSPDLSLSSSGLINDVSWQPAISFGSDHLPIILTINRPSAFMTSERRKFFNQKKANWKGFREYTDRRFSELPSPLMFMLPSDVPGHHQRSSHSLHTRWSNCPSEAQLPSRSGGTRRRA